MLFTACIFLSIAYASNTMIGDVFLFLLVLPHYL